MKRSYPRVAGVSAVLKVIVLALMFLSVAVVGAAPGLQTTATTVPTSLATAGPSNSAVGTTVPVQQTASVPVNQTNNEATNGQVIDNQTTNGQSTNGQAPNGQVTNLNGQASNVQSTNGQINNGQQTMSQSPFSPLVGFISILLIAAFVIFCGFRAWREAVR